MPATYQRIATTAVAAGGASFTSIPQTYTDLRLVFIGAGDGGTLPVRITVNNDTNFIYSQITVMGDGSTTSSYTSSGFSRWVTSDFDFPGSPNFGLVTLDIFGYRGSTFKTALWETSGDRNGSGLAIRQVCLYRSTSPITSLEIIGTSRNYASGSTARLYGILRA